MGPVSLRVRPVFSFSHTVLSPVLYTFFSQRIESRSCGFEKMNALEEKLTYTIANRIQSHVS